MSSFTSNNRCEALKLLLMFQYGSADGITDVNKRLKKMKGRGVSTKKTEENSLHLRIFKVQKLFSRSLPPTIMFLRSPNEYVKTSVIKMLLV